MKRLILVGSPRTEGRSAHLAEMLFEANIDEFPQDELFLVPISEVEVGPCIGCDGCREKSEVIIKGEDGKEASLWKHRCVFDDEMQAIYDLLDDADQVVAVCPVYFSGAPAPFKCLLDRLQPYFWSDARFGEKRSAVLHVLGEGSDPHGFGALVSEVCSALAVAGFKLERVLDWVGCIDAEGEITAEARECDLAEAGSGAFSPAEPAEPGKPAERPKLNLYGSPFGNGKGSAAKAPGAENGTAKGGAARGAAKDNAPKGAAKGGRNAKGRSGGSGSGRSGSGKGRSRG